MSATPQLVETGEGTHHPEKRQPEPSPDRGQQNIPSGGVVKASCRTLEQIPIPLNRLFDQFRRGGAVSESCTTLRVQRGGRVGGGQRLEQPGNPG
jgi:hypothetical protein